MTVPANSFRRLLLFSAAAFLVSVSSCSSDDDLGSDDEIAGTYIGSLNVSSPSFQSTGYSVTVTRLTGNTIRITPSTPHASEWQLTLMKISNSLYTCINCTANQVTINIGDNSTQLNYNYGGNNEQFSGTKQ